MSRSYKINIQPLNLRAINPETIIENYRNGLYNHLSIGNLNSVQNIKVINPNATLITDQNSELYTYHDSNGNQQKAFHLGHKLLTCYKTNGEKMPSKFQCKVCRRNFNLTQGTAMGIPMWISSLNGQTCYGVDGPMCGFRCTFRAVKRRLHVPCQFRDPVYQDSESLLHHWFQQLYPGKKLTESPDPDLLEPHGPLTSEEYDREGVYYHLTPNIGMIPMSRFGMINEV